MYLVTELFKDKIKEKSRVFKARVVINHSTGELILGDKDLALGSLIHTEGSQAGDEFTVGGTVASDLALVILNKPEYANINFIGARLTASVSLLLSSEADVETYFLNAPQPTEFEEGEGVETWEEIPLGVFNIDEAPRQRSTIQIKAIDDMIKLNKPYSLSQLSYPATLYQIYVDICNVADVQIGTFDFPNKDHIVQERPSGDLTLRDVLGYTAELSGTFAKFNRTGALELRWYTSTGLELGPGNRFNFKPSDHTVQIKGVMATVGDTIYLAGADDYAIDLSENPLLQGDYETVLPNIFDHVRNTVFTPYASDWQGNPAIQTGDMITQIDRDGKIYTTLVTNSTYKYRGRSSLVAKGLPEVSKGFKGSADKRIANIVRKEIKPVGDQLNTLEQAQRNAMELMASMLGGYTHFEADSYYIADNPILANSIKVWKWGINGFGYYPNGLYDEYGNPNIPLTAITADGSIVAMLVAANIITANMIQTGLLQSEDGSTWINLDNGEFNFKNAIKWVNGQLVIEGMLDTGAKIFNTTPVPPYKLNDLWKVSGVAGVDFRICTTSRVSGSYVAGDWNNVADSKMYTDLIKNLTTGTSISGGITTINRDKVRVDHSSGQYSELRADGLVRKWLYGEAKYLNDIYLDTFTFATTWSTTKPSTQRIYLPASFRGRGSTCKIFLSMIGWYAIPGDGLRSSGGRLQTITTSLRTVLKVVGSNFDLTTPYVDVDSYIIQTYTDFEAVTYGNIDYGKLDFMIVVVGY